VQYFIIFISPSKLENSGTLYLLLALSDELKCEKL
jgi:hypothetical protein